MKLTQREKQMLREIGQAKRYPITRFELHSDSSDELVMTALDFVRITEIEDSIDLIKERAAALKSLWEKGLVRVDYSVNIWVTGDYDIYYRSAAYELLCHTAMEAAKLPDVLFTIPKMVKGYVRLTLKGESACKLQ